MRKVFFSYINVTNPTAIHPIFKDTLENPPEGYEYVNKSFFTNTSNTMVQPPSKLLSSVVALARVATKIFPMPTIWRLPQGEYELAHVNSHLAISKKPWIFDYEAVHCLTRFNPAELRKPHVKAIIRKVLGGKKCKHLIAMSEGSQRSFNYLFPTLASKSSVVYPAPVLTEQTRKIYEQRMQRLKKKSKEITFLFAARYFKKKGGYEALEAFKLLHAKYKNAKLLVVADIPQELKGQQIPGVTLVDKIGREDMINIHYPAADVFIYPSIYDTFGYVILEAMTFGIPSISTTDNVIPEIVDDGIDGFLVPTYKTTYIDEHGIMKPRYMNFDLLYDDTRPEFQRMVQDLAVAMEKFMQHPELLPKMGKVCFAKVDTGKFSMTVRRQKLKEIYDKALS